MLGGLLVLRSWRRAQSIGWDAAEADDTDYAPVSSFVLAAGMFFVYALLLVGRGLPFWLGTALFVTAFVFLFQYAQRKSQGQTIARSSSSRSPAACSRPPIVTLVFEQLFYVRLPYAAPRRLRSHVRRPHRVRSFHLDLLRPAVARA